MKATTVWILIKTSVLDWVDDGAPHLAAALAFYTIFSLTPLSIIAMAVAAAVWGEAAVQGQVVEQIEGAIGREGATVIQSMIESARRSPETVPAAILGLLVLVFGATVVMGELKYTLNTVWDVPAASGFGIADMIKNCVLSVVMVLGIGLLLLLFVAISTSLVWLRKVTATVMAVPATTWQSVDFFVSLLMLTLLFAMLYKFLPDVRIVWSDVWMGAAVTAVLFNLGKYAIGFYLAYSAPASMYGAAGSVIVLLLWIYYSTLIFLLGAEFTHVYATRYGSRPKADAKTRGHEIYGNI